MNHWQKHDLTYGEDSRDESFTNIFSLGEYCGYSLYYDETTQTLVVEKRNVGYRSCDAIPLFEAKNSSDRIVCEAIRRLYAMEILPRTSSWKKAGKFEVLMED